MIIELPRSFSYVSPKTKQKIAWVKNGTLYISNVDDFDKIMYELTYCLKDMKKCYYCMRKLPKEKVTLDHIYPKDYGGPTVPNNLQPSCSKCNNGKTNMNLEEYLVYRSLERDEKSDFLRELMLKKEKIRKEIGYDFPKELVTTQKTSKIKAERWRPIKGKRYKQVAKQYKKYKTFKKPIVTDKNLNLLDGYSVYLYATTIRKSKVPVIILENVELVN